MLLLQAAHQGWGAGRRLRSQPSCSMLQELQSPALCIVRRETHILRRRDCCFAPLVQLLGRSPLVCSPSFRCPCQQAAASSAAQEPVESSTECIHDCTLRAQVLLLSAQDAMLSRLVLRGKAGPEERARFGKLAFGARKACTPSLHCTHHFPGLAHHATPASTGRCHVPINHLSHPLLYALLLRLGRQGCPEQR
jgi:hypothetical protein